MKLQNVSKVSAETSPLQFRKPRPNVKLSNARESTVSLRNPFRITLFIFHQLSRILSPTTRGGIKAGRRCVPIWVSPDSPLPVERIVDNLRSTQPDVRRSSRVIPHLPPVGEICRFREVVAFLGYQAHPRVQIIRPAVFICTWKRLCN